jgi:hypothetical protein
MNETTTKATTTTTTTTTMTTTTAKTTKTTTTTRRHAQAQRVLGKVHADFCGALQVPEDDGQLLAGEGQVVQSSGLLEQRVQDVALLAAGGKTSE